MWQCSLDLRKICFDLVLHFLPKYPVGYVVATKVKCSAFKEIPLNRLQTTKSRFKIQTCQLNASVKNACITCFSRLDSAVNWFPAQFSAVSRPAKYLTVVGFWKLIKFCIIINISSPACGITCPRFVRICAWHATTWHRMLFFNR